MADYNSSHSGSVVDAAVTKAAQLPAISAGSDGKVLAVNSSETGFELVTPSVPSGTSMLFNQAAAPTGWTKKSNWANDASLVVGNTYASGGSDSPTSWTTAVSTQNHTLTESEIPAHNHDDGTLATASDGAHDHDLRASGGQGGSTYPGSILGSPSYSLTFTAAVRSAGAHTHTVTGSTANTGGGSGHNHSVTQDTYTPRYVTLIAATKD